jgi:hypothetical protein
MLHAMARAWIGLALMAVILGSCAVSVLDRASLAQRGGSAVQQTQVSTDGTYFVVATIGLAIGAYITAHDWRPRP